MSALTTQIEQLERDNKLAQLLIASLYYQSRNIPYVFGGESISGADCSGFMQMVFGTIGVSLPRVSSAQIETGQTISVGLELPGDLLGFDINDRNGAGIEHIGMCIGNGLMIHTAKPGEGIVISDYKKRYGTKFVRVARVF